MLILLRTMHAEKSAKLTSRLCKICMITLSHVIRLAHFWRNISAFCENLDKQFLVLLANYDPANCSTATKILINFHVFEHDEFITHSRCRHIEVASMCLRASVIGSSTDE